MLNLSRLRTLHELSRLGTVGAVARSLAYSPSGVSQQLARLEKETGARLTEQVGRRLVLTDAGRVLVEHAGALLEGVERAEADLAEASWTADPETVMPGTWVRSHLRARDIEPRVRFETIDLLLQAHLVRSGHAVAIIPGLVAREHLGTARLLELSGSPRRQVHTAVRSGRRAHPATRALRTALAEAAATLDSAVPAQLS